MEDLLTQNNIDTDRAVSIVESFLFTFSEPVDIFELISVFKNNDIKADKNI